MALTLTTCVFMALVVAGIDAQGLLLPTERGPSPPKPSPPAPDATYWVMCSNTLRRGHDFVCSARILAGNSPVSVHLILSNNGGDKVLLVSQTVQLNAGVPQELRLPIPTDLEKASDKRWNNNYNFTVSGKGSEVSFTDSKMIGIAEESMAIFVQTDKGIYKFGQLVQFRVLLTSIDLKPMSNMPVDIIIEDPKENRIWQRLGVMTPASGVLDQFSLKLANRAPTGSWKIKVNANNMEEITEFEVDDYVLPRFEVEIEQPPFGLDYDPWLNLTVKATHVFGKPVTEGIARLILDVDCWQSPGKVISTEYMKLNKEGKFIVALSRSQILKYVQDTGCSYWGKGTPTLTNKNFKISANVTEGNTGRMQKTSSEIRFYDNPMKLTFMDVSPSNFKPGLPYTGYVEFKRRDDTDLTGAELDTIVVAINVTYRVAVPRPTTTTTTTTAPPMLGNNTFKLSKMRPMIDIDDRYWYQPEETRELQINNPIRGVSSNGLITITFNVPAEARSARIEVETLKPFKDERTSKFLSKFNSPTDSFLSLSVPPSNTKPKVGDILLVKAKSTSPIFELNYQVFAKGILVKADSVSLSTPMSEHQFQVQLTQVMAPSVRILAFYRKEDNDEFVVDALSLSVEGIFQKPVSVSFSASTVQPGAPVNVLVQGEPQSMVFLASNDKSVGLLKEGNDITQQMVREFLWSLDYGSYFPYMREMFICGGPYYYGGGDARSVFQSAKVIVLTDGLVYTHNDWGRGRGYGGPMMFSESAGGMGPPVMAMADKMSPSQSFSPATVVRKFFPENWLWGSYSVGSNGQVVIPSKAPDTITTWMTTVFSMHPVYGLSVAEAPAELITARDMFVTLDLPLSITKGEDYCFTASVFNYYTKPLPLLLQLNKSEDFKNIQVRRGFMQTVDVTRKNGYTSYFLGSVPVNEVESAMFCITPNNVGPTPIQINALTNVPGLSDAVERIIKVKPEGVPRATSKSYLVDLSSGQWSQDVPVAFPNGTVPDSQYVTFSATGSFLGPVLDNLDDLLRMPYGCGEQNMLNFAPTVFLTDYYFKTNTSDVEKIEKAKKYMLAGYTKELLYEHGKTGAYSTFGNGNTIKNGSLWLTTFVMKTFAQGEQLNSIQEVFPLDKKVLERAVYWITNQANAEGEFIEYGTVFNKRMQGGSSKGSALTAYTVIALHEASKVFNKAEDDRINSTITAAIKKGRYFLETRLSSIRDPYDACIVGYALHLVDSRKKQQSFDNIESLATRGDGLKYWERPSVKKENSYWWSRDQDAISIEATSYCLLTYKERGISNSESLPVIRWLTNQRGPQGGFISTQDTVIGLQALTSVSVNMHTSEDIPMKVVVTYVDASNQVISKEIQINKANEMLLQKVPIPYDNGAPASVNIRAETTGRVAGPTTAMAEMVMDYNVMTETSTVTYNTKHRIQFNENGFKMSISINTVEREPASMTILKVEIPTGYTPDLEPLQSDEFISRSEIEGDNLVLYYNADVITQRGVEAFIVMDAPITGKLVSPKDKSYTVSNYYEPSEEVTKMYSIDQKKNFCEMAKGFSFCPYIVKG